MKPAAPVFRGKPAPKGQMPPFRTPGRGSAFERKSERTAFLSVDTFRQIITYQKSIYAPGTNHFLKQRIRRRRAEAPDEKTSPILFRKKPTVPNTLSRRINRGKRLLNLCSPKSFPPWGKIRPPRFSEGSLHKYRQNLTLYNNKHFDKNQ